MKVTAAPQQKVFMSGDLSALTYTDTPRSQMDILRNAEYQIGHRQFLEAESTLLYYLRNFPMDPMGSYMLGRLYHICEAMHKMRPVGRVLIGDAIARGLKSTSVLVDWAKAWYFDGHPQLAEKIFDQVKNAPDFSIDEKKFYLKLFYRCGRAKEGLALVNEWLASGVLKDLSDPAFQHLTGLLQAEVGNFDEGFRNIDEGSSSLGYAKQVHYSGVKDVPTRLSDIPGGRLSSVVIFAEQGLGDQVLALKPIRNLAEITDGKIIIEAEPRMVSIFRRAMTLAFGGKVLVYPENRVSDAWREKMASLPVEQAVASFGQEIEMPAPQWHSDGHRVEWAMPMRRLWSLFGGCDAAVTCDFAPQLVVPSPEAIAKAKAILGDDPRPVVTVAWLGGTIDTGIKERTLPLDLYKERILDKIRGKVRLVSTQYLGKQPNFAEMLGLEYFPEFDGSDVELQTALYTLSTRLISPVNTNCHLAAEVGTPVTVLAPFGGYNWHFSNVRDDGVTNIWYKPAKVYMQDQPNHWESCLDKAMKALNEEI